MQYKLIKPTMDKAQIKATILKAVKVATEEKGFTLVRGAYYDVIDNNKCACALGCVLIANDCKMYDYMPKLTELLGVEWDWINSFIHAFDGNSTSAPTPEEAKALGEELLAELKPIRHREWEVKHRKEFNAIEFNSIFEAPKEEIKEEKVIETKEAPKEEIKEEVKE